MSRVLSVTLEDEQMARLLRIAEQLGKTPTETTEMFVEERIREDEFPAIEFRSSEAEVPRALSSLLELFQRISPQINA